MKKYSVCFSLLMKRMIKIPAFVLMLAGMLILAIAVSKLEQGERSESAAGVMIEAKTGQDWSKAHEEWNQSLLLLLHEQEGILSFQVYENEEKLMQAVEKGELDCGFILPQDLRDRVNEGNWQDAITLYSSPASVVTQIAKERVAAAVFTLYSEESYVNYVKNISDFDLMQTSESDKEEIIAFAKSAYESHLLDGSTFGLIYNGIGCNENRLDGLNDNDTVGLKSGQQSSAAAFPLRGVLAVCIFLSGMCGLLTDCKDRQEKRFLRIVPDHITTMANVFVPTIYTAVVSVAALICTHQIAGLGGFVKELFRILIYQFLIVAYCSIIRLVLRKQETIAAAIPIFTLACIICCPVWIRLAVYIPVFRVLEKLFPATYYLTGIF